MTESCQDEACPEETGAERAPAEQKRHGAPDLAEIGRIGMELMADIGNAVSAQRDTSAKQRPRGDNGRFVKAETPAIEPVTATARKRMSSKWLGRLLPRNGGLIDAYNALSQTLMKLDERMSRDRDANGYSPSLFERDEDLDRRIADEIARLAGQGGSDPAAEEAGPDPA